MALQAEKQKFMPLTLAGISGAAKRLVHPLNVPDMSVTVPGIVGACVSFLQFSKVDHMFSTPLGITTGDCRFEQLAKQSDISLTPEGIAGARIKELQLAKAAFILSIAGSVVEDRSTYFVELPRRIALSVPSFNWPFSCCWMSLSVSPVIFILYGVSVVFAGKPASHVFRFAFETL